MSQTPTIALDAMGGDHAPQSVVEGAEQARLRYPDARYLFCGDEARIRPLLAKFSKLAAISQIQHTTEAIGPEDKPSQALRRGQNSSMGLAIAAVRSGQAQAAVSAGNTGALMALAKFGLRTIPGIERPALISALPTLRGESVMLDMGANIDCDEDILVQFAIMGAAFARVVLALPEPSVGLLNVGVEELKGNENVKAAGQRLRETPLHFRFAGFIEGDDIGKGSVDVVVTDGFTGNVALKTAEGMGVLFTTLLRRSLTSSWLSKLGYLLAKNGLKSLQSHLDPRQHNGGVLIGLNGLVVKSHGSTDSLGYSNAVGVAIDMAVGDLTQRIADDLQRFGGRREPAQEAL